MIATIISIIGIASATGGSILTLWTMIHDRKSKDGEEVYPYGTWGWLGSLADNHPRERRLVRTGCFLIVIGGLLQIIGQIMTLF